MTRNRLPNRRSSETFDIVAQNLTFTAISRFADGAIAEIFLQNHKAGSMAGINAQDSAVIQYGVPLDVIRKALMRDARGVTSSPLSVVLDHLAERSS